jgi:hypothetical protein
MTLRSTITKANESIRGHDIGDVCDRLWANAFGTGLGGPERDPSPSVSALRAPSLSQEQEPRNG